MISKECVSVNYHQQACDLKKKDYVTMNIGRNTKSGIRFVSVFVGEYKKIKASMTLGAIRNEKPNIFKKGYTPKS